MGRIPCLNRGTWYPVQRALLRSMNKCDCSLDTLILGIGCNLYHLLLPLNFFPSPPYIYIYIYTYLVPLHFVNRAESTNESFPLPHFMAAISVFPFHSHRYFVHYVSTLAVTRGTHGMIRRRRGKKVKGRYRLG